MKPVYALYARGEDAQRAVDGLRASGVADRDITVISGVPMDEFEFSHIDGKNHLWTIACLGGAIGLAASVALTTATSNAWPINVGNMATIAWWAFLVPIFEMTMLGAILATVISLVVTGGLLRRRPQLYDPAISEGKILVGLENPTISDADLQRALVLDPSITLKTV